MNRRSIYDNIISGLEVEVINTLVHSGPVRIERIVSEGHVSPKDAWYDQDQPEWVILIQGSATIEVEGRPDPVELNPGDYVNIPARCRHRVARTDESQHTIWLAVYY